MEKKVTRDTNFSFEKIIDLEERLTVLLVPSIDEKETNFIKQIDTYKVPILRVPQSKT